MLGGGLATGDLSETPACKRSFDANGPAHKTAGPTPWQNSFAQSTATTRRNQHHAALIRRPFHSLKTCMASLQGHAPAHAQTQAPSMCNIEYGFVLHRRSMHHFLQSCCMELSWQPLQSKQVHLSGNGQHCKCGNDLREHAPTTYVPGEKLHL